MAVTSPYVIITTMKRLDRYLVREMVVPFLIGQAAVVLMLTGTVLYNNADTFLNSNVPAAGVVKIAFYFAPYLVNLTMPVAMALAASLMVSRLTRDTEITAMRAAGISLKRIFFPVFIVGIAVSLGDIYFGEKVVPWATQRFEQTLNDLSRSVRFLVPQERQVVQSPDKKLSAYVGRIEYTGSGNRARLHDILIVASTNIGPYRGGSEESPTIVNAPLADYNDGIWYLHDPIVHIYGKHGLDETHLRPGWMQVNFRLAERTFNALYLQMPLYSNTSSSSAQELYTRIVQQRKSGSVNKRDLLDFHFKLSVPFSCAVFALACPPLSLRFARAGNFMGVLLSIILVFVYWNALLAAKILGTKYADVVPPVAAAWGQNLVFASLGAYYLWRQE